MSNTQSIASRYAEALWAVNPEQAGQALTQLQGLTADLTREPIRWGRLNDPTIAISVKLQELQERWPDLSSSTLSFLRLVFKEQRLPLLPMITDSLRKLCLAARNQMEVSVITAVELTHDEQHELSRSLSSRLGKDVILQQRLDPTVIGGVVVTADDWILDLSLAGQLARLRHHLTSHDGVIVDEPTSTRN